MRLRDSVDPRINDMNGFLYSLQLVSLNLKLVLDDV